MGVATRYVSNEGVLTLGGTLHAGEHMAMSGIGGDDEEVLVIELGDREVGLEEALLIKPLGVGDAARVVIDSVGREVIEHAAGIGPLDHELRHERHIHQADVLANGLVLRGPIVEPVFATPAEIRDFGLLALGSKPVGALPAAHIAEVGAVFGKTVMDG